MVFHLGDSWCQIKYKGLQWPSNYLSSSLGQWYTFKQLPIITVYVKMLKINLAKLQYW